MPLTTISMEHWEHPDFRFWHKTDMPTVFRDVRFQGQSGKTFTRVELFSF